MTCEAIESAASKPLSVREESVLSLTCAGLTDKEIAVRLGIGLETVRTYWSRIKEKLQVETRSEAVVAGSNRDIANVVRAHESENQFLLEEIQRRKTAERLLAESESRFKFFCEISSQGIFITDAHGKCNYMNRKALEALGCLESEVAEHGWKHLARESGALREVRIGILDLARTGRYQGCFRLQHQNSVRDVRVSIRVVHHRQGLAGYFGTVEDVSQSMELERKIAEAKQFCECVSAATQDIVYIFEPSTGTVLYVNHASEALFGMTSDQIREMGPGSLAKCIDPADYSQLAEVQSQYSSLADGAALTLRCRAIAADGSTPILEGRVVVFKRDELGIPKKMLGVLKIVREAA